MTVKQLNDDQLNDILQAWRAPRPSPPLEACSLEAFRRRRGSFWRWFIAGSLRVPVPMAAAFIIVLIYSGFRLWRPPAAPQIVVQTRTVEVPVVRERVVTRTVFVERPATPPGSHRAAPLVAGTLRDFQPVTEFAPRVVRSTYEERD